MSGVLLIGIIILIFLIYRAGCCVCPENCWCRDSKGCCLYKWWQCHCRQDHSHESDYQLRRSGFGMRKQPIEQDNTLLNMNPFDEADYQTPTFLNVRYLNAFK